MSILSLRLFRHGSKNPDGTLSSVGSARALPS